MSEERREKMEMGWQERWEEGWEMGDGRRGGGMAGRTSLVAATTPSAMTSHFMMPPKMLTRIAFTRLRA
jgi:hypothetical protein